MTRRTIHRTYDDWKTDPGDDESGVQCDCCGYELGSNPKCDECRRADEPEPEDDSDRFEYEAGPHSRDPIFGR